jgi:hypothetical protein
VYPLGPVTETLGVEPFGALTVIVKLPVSGVQVTVTFAAAVLPNVSPEYATGLGAVQLVGSDDTATLPLPVPIGTVAAYVPVPDVVTAGAAEPPDGVTVTFAFAIPPPRLLVTVPLTVPVSGVHVTVMLTVTLPLNVRPEYDVALGVVQLGGSDDTATAPVPSPTNTLETV